MILRCGSDLYFKFCFSSLYLRRFIRWLNVTRPGRRRRTAKVTEVADLEAETVVVDGEQYSLLNYINNQYEVIFSFIVFSMNKCFFILW